MKNLISLLLILSTLTSIGQNFEGKMIFKNTYQSKMPNVTSEQLTAMFGSVQEYYVKDGEYKSVTNGNFAQWQLYINADNKLYNKFANSDTLFWYDGASNTDEVLNSTVTTTTAQILGYTCEELILTCKSGVQKYYFNPAFGVDHKLYQNHKFGNWYACVSKTNALPLKSVAENEQFIVEMVVVEIIPERLEKTFFELPANTVSKKSPY